MGKKKKGGKRALPARSRGVREGRGEGGSVPVPEIGTPRHEKKRRGIAFVNVRKKRGKSVDSIRKQKSSGKTRATKRVSLTRGTEKGGKSGVTKSYIGEKKKVAKVTSFKKNARIIACQKKRGERKGERETRQKCHYCAHKVFFCFARKRGEDAVRWKQLPPPAPKKFEELQRRK